MNFLKGNDSDDDNLFTINENYAKRYDKWRKSEELQKLKDKYGQNYDEDSSTSEEEDENAVELTEDVERDFFKTLSCLKDKNPKIYDENVKFFKEKQEVASVKKGKTETLTMAAYKRKILLETGGVIEDDDAPKNFPHDDDLPHFEQEKAMKESFKEALQDSDDDGCGSFLKAKIRTKEEKEKEDADYREWLAGQASSTSMPNTDKTEMKGLRDFWTDPKLDDGEKFLRDYILKQRYLEKVNEDDVGAFGGESEDEEMDKKQEEFERKFNFRYEEPDQDFIKRYPRTVEQSMRRKDDRRKIHRDDVKTRKKEEKVRKGEELKRLKALKRAEIVEKIQKLQQVTGNDEMTFQDQDIEGDFNPDEHDRRMAELFNNEFYETNADVEKPEFPDLDEELEIEKWDDWDGTVQPQEGEVHCEDADFVMDCDYDPKSATQQELLESSRKRRKRRQSKFAQAVARPKPVFDPKNTSFEKYLDEYYALDYEDLIGDIPCRFKYRKVVPNDFGLSVEEILEAPDKELNRWASSKKIMQRRPDHIEQYEVKAYKRKAQNVNKKRQCLPSLYAIPEEEVNDVDHEIATAAKRNESAIQKKKKSRKISDTKSSTGVSGEIQESISIKPNALQPQAVSKKKKKKRKATKTNAQSDPLVKKPKNPEDLKSKKKKDTKFQHINSGSKWHQPESENVVENLVSSMSDARLKSYGLNPKKFKNKIKYSKK